MYLTVKQQLKHLSKQDYKVLRELSHMAKNLANQAIYNVRQYYFTEGEYLNYEKNYALLKSSENYKMLNSNMAQQILKEVDGSFKSFFGLLKLARKGTYRFQDCKLPGYLPKDGVTTLVIGFVRLKENKFILPFSQTYKKNHNPITITLPPILKDKKVKEIRIIPKGQAEYFEIQYTYEQEVIPVVLYQDKALGVDLGVDNLATCVSTDGRTFLIDGRRLKSMNQWYNKELARLQSIKDKQGIKGHTKRIRQLTRKRNHLINDYVSKAARLIINDCIKHQIGILVVGYHETFQREIHLGRRNNQSFVNIPFGKFREKLEYLCQLYRIQFVKQEESYTSKASFFDGDVIPVYNHDNPKDYVFSGIRIKRGLYKTGKGYCFNADVNGALNILLKSKVVSLQALYDRGEVDTPVRIRVA